MLQITTDILQVFRNVSCLRNTEEKEISSSNCIVFYVAVYQSYKHKTPKKSVDIRRHYCTM
jgi:hypothetical protein